MRECGEGEIRRARVVQTSQSNDQPSSLGYVPPVAFVDSIECC